MNIYPLPQYLFYNYCFHKYGLTMWVGAIIATAWQTRFLTAREAGVLWNDAAMK